MEPSITMTGQIFAEKIFNAGVKAVICKSVNYVKDK